MGLVDAQGSVKWNEQELLGHKTYDIARHGLGYVPESRDVFPKLTVEAEPAAGPERAARSPDAGEPGRHVPDVPAPEGAPAHRGRRDVGREQQMLTLCRTLMGDPDLIMIDEPTEGLAPKIVELVGEYLKELQKRGLAVLLVEQKLDHCPGHLAALLCDGPRRGGVFHGTPDELRADQYVRKEWLEV